MSARLDASSWRAAAATPTSPYALPVPRGDATTLSLGWLVLALAALTASGVYSVLLVLARTPGVSHWLPVADFFRVALVVHVDLSVLVWFAAIAAMLWSLNTRARLLAVGRCALALSALGTAVVVVSAFVGSGAPVMSNYVPVLESRLFLYGLALFGAGFALTVLRSLLVPARIALALDGEGALRFGLNASVVAAAIALFALAWSWIELPRDLAAKAYFEMLFWGSGHAIQFTWTLLMLVAWLWLGTLIGAPAPLSPRVAVLLFAVALVSVFAVPFIYFAWPVTSNEHRTWLTWLMRFGGGLAIVPVVLAVLAGLLRAAAVPTATTGASRASSAASIAAPLKAALLSSVVLFCLGGLIGFLIRGSDVRIPAHYHGSIVGVTLALMGLTYALLPRFGYAAPRGRLAVMQPWLYGGGQVLHIVGLVWSGGYGVQRKVAGAEQVLRSTQEVIGMGLMGLGGLVAVIGGTLFLVVALRTMLGGRATR